MVMLGAPSPRMEEVGRDEREGATECVREGEKGKELGRGRKREEKRE